jgi:hypothetical protein
MDLIETGLVNMTNFVWSRRRHYERQVVDKIKKNR